MDEAKKLNNKPEKGGQPGIYKHPFVSEELHATSFPQADALLRQGWVYDRELPKSQQITNTPSVNPNAAAEVADLRARLAAAEAQVATATAQVKANAATESDANKQAAQETLDREKARQEQEEARTKSTAKADEARKTLGKESK